MVARFYEKNVDSEALRTRLRPGKRGNSLLELQAAAEFLGMRSRAVHVGQESLLGVTLPAIAHLTDGHYLVLYAVNAVGVVAGDPAKGVVTLTTTAFARSWSGHLLLLARRPRAPPRRNLPWLPTHRSIPPN